TCTISAINAEDVALSTSTVQNGVLTLDGLQFKIPQEFTAVESDQDNSEPGDAEHIDGTTVDKESSTEFRNQNGEKLDIKVGSKTNSNIETLNLPSAQKKNIAGKDGYFWTEMDDGKTEYNFEYINNGKVVKIETYDENLINQIVS
ncbi:MAG: hypothetical protein IJJ47_05065, partial [Methanosphaera sp.]|nr:hypothetical protein [Methanosphaera sp.]